MSRYFVTISEKEFEKKFDGCLEQDEDMWLDGSYDRDPLDYYALQDKLGKDLKVTFDLENVGEDYDPREIMGIRTLPNGLTYRGIMAGGDWEYPVFWIVYWDGKRLRGYVPTDGNPYNTDTMEAYGNNPESDGRNIRKRYPELYSAGLGDAEHWYSWEHALKTDAKRIIADIENRIRLRKP